MLENLTSEQFNVFLILVRDVILRKPGKYFINSSGGTGKTEFIKTLYKYLESLGKKQVVTTTTGSSSFNLSEINAQTLHSAMCIYDHNFDSPFLNKNINEKIRFTDILYVDEASLISQSLLTKLIKRLDDSKIYNTLPILFTGDVRQLPCVKGKSFWMDSNNIQVEKFNSDLKLGGFTKNFRNTNESTTLDRIRDSTSDIVDLAYLNRTIQISDLSEIDPFQTTTIFRTNECVSAFNMFCEKKFGHQSQMFEAIDHIQWPFTGAEEILKSLPSSETFNLSQNLLISEGSPVCLTLNLNLKKGLYNGQRGVISKIEENFVEVLFDNVNMTSAKIYKVEKSGFVNRVGYLTRKQYPFKLGFAYTLYYSQGKSLSHLFVAMKDYAVDNQYLDNTESENLKIDKFMKPVDDGIWRQSEFYVAISRVHELKNFHVDRRLKLTDIKINLNTSQNLHKFDVVPNYFQSSDVKIYYQNVERNMRQAIDLTRKMDCNFYIFIEVLKSDLNFKMDGYVSTPISINDTRNFLILSKATIGNTEFIGYERELTSGQFIGIKVGCYRVLIVHNETYISQSSIDNLRSKYDIVLGDFNLNLKNGLLSKIPTTKKGTSIDNIFIDLEKFNLDDVYCLPTCYSYHSGFFILLNTEIDEMRN